jgi:hypothetical protein
MQSPVTMKDLLLPLVKVHQIVARDNAMMKPSMMLFDGK